LTLLSIQRYETEMDDQELQSWLQRGGTLLTSGTTGPQKEIIQSVNKLSAANLVAIESQHLTPGSKVYTVCSMKHAGGLLAQTLPALSIGAEVVIDTFNAYKFVREITKYTHTHLTPAHCHAVMSTRSFDTLDLSNLWVTCGSDYVTWDIIEAFVKQGAVFMANWGMSEVGPCAINTVFRNMYDVAYYRAYAIDGATIMGDSFYCEWDIINSEFCVRGDICVYNDWFSTGDDVVVNSQGHLYYMGRK